MTNAVSNGGVNVARYRNAIQGLKTLASLPETSDTTEHKAEALADLQALNTFFGTTDLYE